MRKIQIEGTIVNMRTFSGKGDPNKGWRKKAGGIKRTGPTHFGGK